MRELFYISAECKYCVFQIFTVSIESWSGSGKDLFITRVIILLVD